MLLLTNLRRRPADEGSALAAVLGVMAVTLIVSIAIASATLSSLGFTSATRAGVQAQSAAEAGIDDTEAKLARSACNPAAYRSLVEPVYAVEIFTQESGNPTWALRCPSPATTSIKLKSTGSAVAVGAGGNGTGNTRVIEAIYLPPVSSSVGKSGPAVYAYSATGFEGSGTLLSVNGSKPSVLLRKDDVACNGGGFVTGDLVAAEGSISIGGSCSVSGSVWAKKKVSINGGLITIGGDVTSGYVGPDDAMLVSGARVVGDAWAAGPMTLTWGTVIEGDATAPSLNLAGGNVKGQAWAAGAATFGGGAVIDGRLTAKSTNSSSSAGGGANIVAAGPGPGPAAGPTPVVPNWVDFQYVKSAWVGFSEVAISGACDWTAFKNAAAALASGPGIIDARGCTNPVAISAADDKLILGNDLVIVAKSFNLGGGGGFTASAERKLWLITPDLVADGKPTCPTTTPASAGPFVVGGGFTMAATVRAMVYSPCLVSITSGINWYGQVFAGGVKIDGAAKLNYVPIGLPGVNLSEGTVTSPSTAGGLGERTSIRDLGSNG
jgi:cytoskeletal protein CcmA (bactofilin family)